MPSRTFKLTQPRMEGGDVKNWQRELVSLFAAMDIDNAPVTADGEYGMETRSITAALARALGMDPEEVMADGVTPELRRRMRDRDLTAEEKERFQNASRKAYRARLRKQWRPERLKVHAPVTRIIADSWGYHPPVHDGIDVICPPNAVLFAMVRSKVIDVRAGGWWGKAPSGDTSKGDGIVQLEILETVGPFKRGHHIGYGHAEKATVRVGDVVEAGEPIARAGLAVAWHIHLMLNDGSTSKGIGNRDPRAILDYAVAND
jgi:murein DD-endopeptidase MepM/ murein hydrolase activator NlpD